MEVISRSNKTINGYNYTLTPTDKKSTYKFTRSKHLENGNGLIATVLNLTEPTSITVSDVSQTELNKIHNNIEFAFELLYEMHCGKMWYMIIFTLDRPYDEECYPSIDHYKIEKFAFGTPFNSEQIDLDYAFDMGKFIIGIDYKSDLEEHSYYIKNLKYQVNKPCPMYKALIPLTDDEINNLEAIKDAVLKMFAKHPTVIHYFDDVLDRFRGVDQKDESDHNSKEE